QSQRLRAGERQLDREGERAVALVEENEDLAADLDGALTPRKVFDRVRVAKGKRAQRRDDLPNRLRRLRPLRGHGMSPGSLRVRGPDRGTRGCGIMHRPVLQK